MRVLEYSEIDPLDALNVSLLALDFAFTPEKAKHIRRSDPRPFPEFAIYAVEGDIVLGQVGVCRLPMISTEGREDVGGVWAVSTHPEHAGRGIASFLLEESHTRMRNAGLRFSTLSTNRYRIAYKLYRRHGYEDTGVWASALTRWETAHQPTRLHAKPPGFGGFDLVEEVFENVASTCLGFAWRHKPFSRLRMLNLTDIYVLWDNKRPVGYALTQPDKVMVSITELLLEKEYDLVEAVAAVVAILKGDYVRVAVNLPGAVSRFRKAGYLVAHPNWSAFMIKPLVPEVTVEDARRLFGIGTDRFLISWLDVT